MYIKSLRYDMIKDWHKEKYINRSKFDTIISNCVKDMGLEFTRRQIDLMEKVFYSNARSVHEYLDQDTLKIRINEYLDLLERKKETQYENDQRLYKLKQIETNIKVLYINVIFSVIFSVIFLLILVFVVILFVFQLYQQYYYI